MCVDRKRHAVAGKGHGTVFAFDHSSGDISHPFLSNNEATYGLLGNGSSGYSGAISVCDVDVDSHVLRWKLPVILHTQQKECASQHHIICYLQCECQSSFNVVDIGAGNNAYYSVLGPHFQPLRFI